MVNRAATQWQATDVETQAITNVSFSAVVGHLGAKLAVRLAAQARGVRFGRPSKLSPEQIALGQRLIDEGSSVREAAKLLKCHHATLYRSLKGSIAVL